MEERKNIYGKVKVRMDTTNLTPMVAARKIHERLKGRTSLLEMELEEPIELV